MNRSGICGAAKEWTAVLMAVLLMTSGCETGYPSLTCAVWKSESLRNFHEPADDPRVAVYVSKQPRDLLVAYDEVSERRNHLRRRAFYAEANLARLQAGKRPRYVSVSRTNGLQLLPVGTFSAVAGEVPGPGMPGGDGVPAGAAAWISADGRTCLLVTEAGERLEFELPTYVLPGATALRVALTPLAVVGDTAAAAAVVAFVVAVSLAASGFTYSP
jgi:hypothetical protein